MSDQPIHNPPSYYLLPDGTEIREMIRQARGDESTIEHLTQSIMEYASRLGKKPGVSRADDFRKIARNAIQGVNVCEGRSVSDNGDPPTEPTGIDLSRVVGMLTRGGVVHLYEREDDLRAAMDSPDGWDRVMWTDGARIHTADTNEPTPTPAPPPEPERPSVALPVVFAGERVPASGVYVGTSPAECEWSAFFIAGHTAPSPIIGPIPPACEWPTKPEGEQEGEDA